MLHIRERKKSCKIIVNKMQCGVSEGRIVKKIVRFKNRKKGKKKIEIHCGTLKHKHMCKGIIIFFSVSNDDGD